MDVFDSSPPILTPPIFLERLHYVPYREQGDGNSVERVHLHARLVRRFDTRRHDDPVRSCVEAYARRGKRDRIGVREDLPDRFHRLECGDFGGGKRVTFFDVPCADGADRRGLETNQPGRHRAAVHVRLRPDVDHLRHRERKRLPRYFIVRALSTHRRGSFQKERGATRAHEAFVKSRRRTRKELSTMRERPASCVRKGMRARRDGKGVRSAGSWKRSSRRAIATCATRYAKEKRRGET